MPLRLEYIIDGLGEAVLEQTQIPGFGNGKIVGDNVCMEIYGVEVLGRVFFRSRRLIKVEIVSPFSGLVCETGSIPLFALKFCDAFGAWGDERIMVLLADAYEFCCFATEHKEDLKKCVTEYNLKYQSLTDDTKERRQIQCQIDDIKTQRCVARRALRAGEIDSKEYNKKWAAMKKQLIDLEQALKVDPWILFQTVFCDNLETPVFNVDMYEAMKFIVAD